MSFGQVQTRASIQTYVYGGIMQSSEFRTNPRFLRNEFVPKGRTALLKYKSKILTFQTSIFSPVLTRNQKKRITTSLMGFISLLTIIVLMVSIIIPKEPLHDTVSMLFFFPRTFLSIKKCHCGDKLKVSAKIAGLRHIGRVKDWLLSRQSVGALQEVMNSASKL